MISRLVLNLLVLHIAQGKFKQVSPEISRSYKYSLWQSMILGLDSHGQIKPTVFYLLNCILLTISFMFILSQSHRSTICQELLHHHRWILKNLGEKMVKAYKVWWSDQIMVIGVLLYISMPNIIFHSFSMI